MICFRQFEIREKENKHVFVVTYLACMHIEEFYKKRSESI